MSTVAINMRLSVDPDKLCAQIDALFKARVACANQGVENSLDEVVDLLDNMLEKANDAENKRGENEA